MTTSAKPKCKADPQVFQRTGSLWESQIRINGSLPRGGAAGISFQIHKGRVSSGDLLVSFPMSNWLRICIANGPHSQWACVFSEFGRALRIFTFFGARLLGHQQPGAPKLATRSLLSPGFAQPTGDSRKLDLEEEIELFPASKHWLVVLFHGSWGLFGPGPTMLWTPTPFCTRCPPFYYTDD